MSDDALEESPEVDRHQDAIKQTDVELEAAGTPTNDGPGIRPWEQAIVRSPSIAGSKRADTETTARNGGVTVATIVLSTAVETIARDWAHRRCDAGKWCC
ncbi:MAG: hypothetical protein F4088_03580 [Chloroflexi bacterium]|nr:hypothetical protein [Chloroflexota bacterium]